MDVLYESLITGKRNYWRLIFFRFWNRIMKILWADWWLLQKRRRRFNLKYDVSSPKTITWCWTDSWKNHGKVRFQGDCRNERKDWKGVDHARIIASRKWCNKYFYSLNCSKITNLALRWIWILKNLRKDCMGNVSFVVWISENSFSRCHWRNYGREIYKFGNFCCWNQLVDFGKSASVIYRINELKEVPGEIPFNTKIENYSWISKFFM